MIARDRSTTIKPSLLGERTYYAQNWRGDVVMLIRPDGQPAESVRYSAYGRPFNIRSDRGADFNGDGVVDLLDLLEFNSIYSPDNGLTKVSLADVNLDGTVDLLDLLAFNAAWSAELGTATGRDVLTAGETRAHGGNRKGYAGYEHEPWWTEFTLSGTPPTGVPNAEAGPLMQLARHRFYRADLGTWTRRDPLGYVDGVNRYSYLRGSPVGANDPLGLATCSQTGRLPPAPCSPCADRYCCMTCCQSMYPNHIALCLDQCPGNYLEPGTDDCCQQICEERRGIGLPGWYEIVTGTVSCQDGQLLPCDCIPPGGLIFGERIGICTGETVNRAISKCVMDGETFQANSGFYSCPPGGGCSQPISPPRDTPGHRESECAQRREFVSCLTRIATACCGGTSKNGCKAVSDMVAAAQRYFNSECHRLPINP